MQLAQDSRRQLSFRNLRAATVELSDQMGLLLHIVAFTALIGVANSSLLDAPSLRLRIILAGQNMVVHGQRMFDVFANPIAYNDGQSVRYDGFAAFTEEDVEITYIVSNGSAYVVERDNSGSPPTVKCCSFITPFNLIVSALNTVEVVPSASVNEEEISCPDGTLLQTSEPFGGVDFKLCALGKAGFTAFGGDMMMEVEYLGGPLRHIKAPALRDAAVSCAIVSKPEAVTPRTIALLTGDVIV